MQQKNYVVMNVDLDMFLMRYAKGYRKSELINLEKSELITDERRNKYMISENDFNNQVISTSEKGVVPSEEPDNNVETNITLDDTSSEIDNETNGEITDEDNDEDDYDDDDDDDDDYDEDYDEEDDYDEDDGEEVFEDGDDIDDNNVDYGEAFDGVDENGDEEDNDENNIGNEDNTEDSNDEDYDEEDDYDEDYDEEDDYDEEIFEDGDEEGDTEDNNGEVVSDMGITNEEGTIEDNNDEVFNGVDEEISDRGITDVGDDIKVSVAETHESSSEMGVESETLDVTANLSISEPDTEMQNQITENRANQVENEDITEPNEENAVNQTNVSVVETHESSIRANVEPEILDVTANLSIPEPAVENRASQVKNEDISKPNEENTVNQANVQQMQKQSYIQTGNIQSEDIGISDSRNDTTEDTFSNKRQEVDYTKGVSLVDFLKANKHIRRLEDVLKYYTMEEIEQVKSRGRLLIKKGRVIV